MGRWALPNCYNRSVGQIWFDENADRALSRLESDAGARLLQTRVQAVLDLLARNPSHETLRRRRLHIPSLWWVTVVAGNEELVILWEPHPTIPDDVLVHYVGPASFA